MAILHLRQLRPHAATFRALNRSGDKSHSLHSIVDGWEVQIIWQLLTTHFGFDRARGFEIDVGEGFNKRLRMSGRQARESFRDVTHIRVAPSKDSPRSIRVLHGELVRLFL